MSHVDFAERQMLIMLTKGCVLLWAFNFGVRVYMLWANCPWNAAQCWWELEEQENREVLLSKVVSNKAGNLSLCYFKLPTFQISPSILLTISAQTSSEANTRSLRKGCMKEKSGLNTIICSVMTVSYFFRTPRGSQQLLSPSTLTTLQNKENTQHEISLPEYWNQGAASSFSKRKEGEMAAATKSIRRAGEILYFPTAVLHQGKPQNSFAAAP